MRYTFVVAGLLAMMSVGCGGATSGDTSAAGPSSAVDLAPSSGGSPATAEAPRPQCDSLQSIADYRLGTTYPSEEQALAAVADHPSEYDRRRTHDAIWYVKLDDLGRAERLVEIRTVEDGWGVDATYDCRE